MTPKRQPSWRGKFNINDNPKLKEIVSEALEERRKAGEPEELFLHRMATGEFPTTPKSSFLQKGRLPAPVPLAPEVTPEPQSEARPQPTARRMTVIVAAACLVVGCAIAVGATYFREDAKPATAAKLSALMVNSTRLTVAEPPQASEAPAVPAPTKVAPKPARAAAKQHEPSAPPPAKPRNWMEMDKNDVYLP